MSRCIDVETIVANAIIDTLEYTGDLGVPLPAHILRTYVMAQVELVVSFTEVQSAINRLAEKNLIGHRCGAFVDGLVSSAYDHSKDVLW